MATPNLRKAAILLHGLPPTLAAELQGKLPPQHRHAVGREIEALGEVDRAAEEAVMREFAGASATLLDQLKQAAAVPFRFLHDVDADTLLSLIADEHPQTIALLLSYLPPEQAASVLAELGFDVQLSVLCRLATMREVSPEAVRDVERGLKHRLAGAAASPRAVGCVAGVVEMFHAMDPVAERRLLGKLADVAPELAQAIRHAMSGIDLASPEHSGAEQIAC